MSTTQQRAYLYHTRKKQQETRKTQQHRKKRRNRERQEKRNLMFRLKKSIDHHFPHLYEKIEEIPECRKSQPEYSLVELIMAGVAMFLFKKGSRNALNNERSEPQFRINYARVFKARLPHLDTVEDVLERLDDEHLEVLKTELVTGLLAKKRFRKYRLFGQSYLVVIDGTHVMDVPEGHCAHCACIRPLKIIGCAISTTS